MHGTHPKRVAVVNRNLQLLVPSLNGQSARKVYREFGRTMADYFYIGTRPPSEAMGIIERIEGQEILEAVHRQGKGALVVTGHFGLFELGGLLMAKSGIPSVAVTLPEPSPALTEWRRLFRYRWNVDTIEIGSDSFAFLQVAQRLRQKQFVATLIDRPHQRESAPVSFPGGTAYFSAGILLLAARSEVPVIPATMVRQDNGFYHARIFPPMCIKERESAAETCRFYSQQIADILLPTLSRHPEQWYQFVPLSPSS